MRDLSIPANGAYSLRLSADARLSSTDYLNDQIWELILGDTEPPSIALQTRYGLRAKKMMIFPGFSWGKKSVTNPQQFTEPPVVRTALSNYARLTLKPFDELEVTAEYWIPDSHTAAGRITVHHLGDEPHELFLRLFTVLQPDENGRVMGAANHAGVIVLEGATGGLAPVLFLSGGATVVQAAYPAVGVQQIFAPGVSRSWTWVLASESNKEQSFQRCKEMVGGSWDSEIARVSLKNGSLIDIKTGNPEWDAAFWMSQKVVLGSSLSPTKSLPHPSLVQSRIPDKGFSSTLHGEDYPSSWSGQTAHEVFLPLMNIIPVEPEFAKGVIRNFIHVQEMNGSIDWKPGLGGQRNGALCTPFLAEIAWRIYQHSEDREFLQEVHDPIYKFFKTWFTRRHDRDGDGFPEWDHSLQSGYDDWPLFARWTTWGCGLDISTAETSDLGAYLFKECNSLAAMASELEKHEHLEWLNARADILRESIEASWGDESHCYQHVDRDIHNSPQGEMLGHGEGTFDLELDRTFENPVRVYIRFRGERDGAKSMKVNIHTRGPRGGKRVERLTAKMLAWYWELGTVTSAGGMRVIDRIEIRGVRDDIQTEIWIADYARRDLSNLLPLWAGIPDDKRADLLVKRTLLDPKSFWRMHGLPRSPATDPAYVSDREDGSGGVSMLWNSMIGEGLLEYGFHAEAAELVTRLMSSIVHQLKMGHSFRERYDPDGQIGYGERDHLAGIAPLDLFLRSLGVRLISPRKVWVCAANPYPWPVAVRWRGLEIHCEFDKTIVVFPDGGVVEIRDNEPTLVEQLDERIQLDK
jgi:hypothetical protein